MQITIKNCDPAKRPEVGAIVYVIKHTHIHHNEKVEYYFQEATPRTNLSREEREKGWLGTTNDWQADSLGQFKLVGMELKTLKNGEDRTILHFKEISN